MSSVLLDWPKCDPVSVQCLLSVGGADRYCDIIILDALNFMSLFLVDMQCTSLSKVPA